VLIASNIYVHRKSYKVDRAPTTAHVINNSSVNAAHFYVVVNTLCERQKDGEIS